MESAKLLRSTLLLMCQSQVCRIHDRLRPVTSVVGPFSHVAFLLSCVVSSEFKQLVPAHKEHISCPYPVPEYRGIHQTLVGRQSKCVMDISTKQTYELLPFTIASSMNENRE